MTVLKFGFVFAQGYGLGKSMPQFYSKQMNALIKVVWVDVPLSNKVLPLQWNFS